MASVICCSGNFSSVSVSDACPSPDEALERTRTLLLQVGLLLQLLEKGLMVEHHQLIWNRSVQKGFWEAGVVIVKLPKRSLMYFSVFKWPLLSIFCFKLPYFIKYRVISNIVPTLLLHLMSLGYVWMVRTQYFLFDFLEKVRTILDKIRSNWRSTIPWYFPLKCSLYCDWSSFAGCFLKPAHNYTMWISALWFGTVFSQLKYCNFELKLKWDQNQNIHQVTLYCYR